MMIRVTFFLICWLGLFTNIFSQAVDSLPSDEVQVIKRFRSNIKHSRKVAFSPEPLSIDTTSRNYDYTTSFITPELEVEKARLEYRPLRPISLYHPNHLYAKVGFGTPQQAFADVSYGQLDAEVVAWNIDFRHHSYNVSESYNDFSNTEGGMMGIFKVHPDWSIEGNLRASQIKHQYFPLYKDSLYEESDATRKWSSITPTVKLHGHWNEFNIVGELDYRYDKENIASESSIFRQQIQIHKHWNDRHGISFVLENQLGVQRLDTFENQLPFTQFHPSYSILTEKFALEAGFKLVRTDVVNFIPDVSTSFAFDARKSLKIEYSGFDRPWTLPVILSSNPFISNLQSLDMVQRSREAIATWRHRISRLQYYVATSYASLKDHPFYLNNPSQSHTFDVIAAEGNSISLEVGLDVRLLEDGVIGIQFEKSYFDLKNQVKPWHLPTYQIHIFGEHSLFSEDLWIKIELIMRGDAAYKADFTSDILEPYVFLGLNSKYSFNQHWAAFLDINNILNQSNPLFLGYESIGLNFTSGIILKY